LPFFENQRVGQGGIYVGPGLVVVGRVGGLGVAVGPAPQLLDAQQIITCWWSFSLAAWMAIISGVGVKRGGGGRRGCGGVLCLDAGDAERKGEQEGDGGEAATTEDGGKWHGKPLFGTLRAGSGGGPKDIGLARLEQGERMEERGREFGGGARSIFLGGCFMQLYLLIGVKRGTDPGLKARVNSRCFRGLKPPAPSGVSDLRLERWILVQAEEASDKSVDAD